MGWASAGEIFDPVAQALIDLGASRDVKRKVLGTLIDKLRDGDWDTCDESLAQFGGDVDIVALFVERGIGSDLSGLNVDGVIGYDSRRDVWTLTCDGRNGCGLLDSGDGRSAAAHDRLVYGWVTHERERHGGDGTVPTWMLFDHGADH